MYMLFLKNKLFLRAFYDYFYKSPGHVQFPGLDLFFLVIEARETYIKSPYARQLELLQRTYFSQDLANI